MSLRVEEVVEAEEVAAGVVAVAAVVVHGEVVAAAAPRAAVVMAGVVGKAVAAAAMKPGKVVEVGYGSLKVPDEVNPLAEVVNLHTRHRTIQVLQAILSNNGR